VAVIDPARPQVTLREQDLEIEWYSGTGAGGQHKNKKMCSCRITHVPTGIVATAQTRERPNSYKLARADIESKVAKQQIALSDQKIELARKQQIGSGMRGDKIRTIRFQDDSAVDHRNGKRISAEKYMKGMMDLLWT
jgi:peptide chain release factor 1